MFEAVAFYLFSALTILMFALTVTSKNALIAMSSLAAGMIFIGAFFFMLDADFMGIVQIIVYTGAVIALYAFGMMFFDTTKDIKERIQSKKIIYVLTILSAVTLVIILCAPIYSSKIVALYPMLENVANPQMVGVVLFTKYLVPFEVAAIMLLVAMIVGIILVSKKMDPETSIENEVRIKEFGLEDLK
jgi:NADH-quinone oxidoreductase subunit J